MEWLTILQYLFLLYCVIQLLRLLLSDCDLQLQWAEKFGVSTGVLARKFVWITGASSGIGEYLAYELAKAGSRLVLTARREEELQRVKKHCLTVLARKVVWITGASSGIGEYLAYELANSGSRLVLTARREEELQRVKKQCLRVLARKVVWITGASSGIGEYLAYELAKAGSRLVLTARREEELQRVKKHCLTVLARKVVWMVGASSGIGEYLAYELAKAGSRLVLTARREEELQRVKQHCLSFGTLMDEDIVVLPMDMLKFDQHRPAYQEIVTRFGQVDILVNNAGRSQRAAWEETDIEVDRQMLEINVLSVLSLTKVVLPDMLSKKSGHIVNMSSIGGKVGAPHSGSYTGAKHAIQGWFDCLRVEVAGRNVSVTNLCPGPVFSNLLKDCFTAKAGESLKGEMKSDDRRMKTARCARLCSVAIANKLDEVWISQHPVLLITYINQYMPSIYMWLSKRIGVKVAMKARDGK